MSIKLERVKLLFDAAEHFKKRNEQILKILHENPEAPAEDLLERIMDLELLTPSTKHLVALAREEERYNANIKGAMRVRRWREANWKPERKQTRGQLPEYITSIEIPSEPKSYDPADEIGTGEILDLEP